MGAYNERWTEKDALELHNDGVPERDKRSIVLVISFNEEVAGVE